MLVEPLRAWVTRQHLELHRAATWKAGIDKAMQSLSAKPFAPDVSLDVELSEVDVTLTCRGVGAVSLMHSVADDVGVTQEQVDGVLTCLEPSRQPLSKRRQVHRVAASLVFNQALVHSCQQVQILGQRRA